MARHPPRITLSNTKIQPMEGVLGQPCPKGEKTLGWVQLQQKSLLWQEIIDSNPRNADQDTRHLYVPRTPRGSQSLHAHEATPPGNQTSMDVRQSTRTTRTSCTRQNSMNALNSAEHWVVWKTRDKIWSPALRKEGFHQLLSLNKDTKESRNGGEKETSRSENTRRHLNAG